MTALKRAVSIDFAITGQTGGTCLADRCNLLPVTSAEDAQRTISVFEESEVAGDDQRWRRMCQQKARELKRLGQTAEKVTHGGVRFEGWYVGSEPTVEKTRGNSGPGSWWEVFYRTSSYYVTVDGRLLLLRTEWYEGPEHRDQPNGQGGKSETVMTMGWSHRNMQLVKNR